MFVYDPSDNSSNGGYKFAWSYLPVAFTNGPAGQTNYTDDTWGFGINFTTGGSSRMDATKPSLGITFESKYYGNSVFGTEFHLQGYDLGGNNHRPFGGFFAHDPAATASGLGLSFNYLGMTNWNDGTEMLRLVYPGSALFGTQMLTVTLPSTAVSGNSLLALRGPGSAISGTIFAVDIQIKADDVRAKLINTSTGGVASAAMSIEAAGGGDSSLVFSVGSGTTSWVIGCDNSDSDAFVIGRHFGLGNNNRIRIDADAVAFAVPAKLPSFTVAGVPSASTAGAGAMIYVSDETGGAVPAFSDGTDWRRVTDRAVIS